MNAFYEHHKDSIRFGYRCFDRILLNGLIQPFQQPGAWSAMFRCLPAATYPAGFRVEPEPRQAVADVARET